ncbi:MAG TPA: hypothetical protein V6C91_17680 [Coleofasciculaceae cyanobacterium]
MLVEEPDAVSAFSIAIALDFSLRAEHTERMMFLQVSSSRKIY